MLPDILQSQYLASFKMLRQAIEKCPEALWNDTAYKNRTWHIAYHALFYTHLYLSETEKTFTAWSKHREDYNLMGPKPWPPHDMPIIGDPYTRAEVLEYVDFVEGEVRRVLPLLHLESSESGFFWLPFSKLELQFYNLRHLAQHTGEIMERLGVSSGIDVDWVGMVND